MKQHESELSYKLCTSNKLTEVEMLNKRYILFTKNKCLKYTKY
jgi:hypothetical protein